MKENTGQSTTDSFTTPVNRVAESSLVTIDLSTWLSEQKPVEFDLKNYLVQGIALMEKPFRENLKALDLDGFHGKPVCVFCSVDAVIPMWAYMLVACKLTGVASETFFGNSEQWREKQLLFEIEKLDEQQFAGKRVVLKGCGDYQIGPAAYMAVSAKLKPVVQSLMFGEPCSTVPIHKRKPQP